MHEKSIADNYCIFPSEVSLVGKVYSGKGRFILNKDIPSSFSGYKYPAQEIPFEFHAREIERN